MAVFFVTLQTVQKISFGDKEYVKASEVAKRFKYTQDYVGQLCRGKKVEARLVGRTWYVVVDSVTAYRKTKHKTQKTAKKTVGPRLDRAKKPTPVSSVLRTKTAKIAAGATPATSRVCTVVDYSSDETSFIPIMHNSRNVAEGSASGNVDKTIAVTATPAPKVLPPKRIKVVAHSKTTTLLSSEKIPEIVLSAKLKVKGEDAELLTQSKEDSPTLVKHTVPKVVLPELPTTSRAPQLNDATVARSTAPAVITVPSPKQAIASAGRLKMYVRWSLVLLGLIVAVGLVGIESEVIAAPSSKTVNFVFDTANFSDLLRYIKQ